MVIIIVTSLHVSYARRTPYTLVAAVPAGAQARKIWQLTPSGKTAVERVCCGTNLAAVLDNLDLSKFAIKLDS